MAMIVPKKWFFLMPTKSMETFSVYVAVHGEITKKGKYTKIINTIIYNRYIEKSSV